MNTSARTPRPTRRFRPAVLAIAALVLATIASLLSPVGSAGASGSFAIGDSVTYQTGAPAPGVKLNLYQSNSSKARLGFLGADTTDAAGTYGFQVPQGCYIVVFIAPSGTSWSATGDVPFREQWGCVNTAPGRSDFDGVLHDAGAPQSAPNNSHLGDRITFADGSGASDIKVTLWTANQSLQRQNFVTKVFTDANGYYGFDVDNGCWVVVMEAPSGTSWHATNQVTYTEHGACVQNQTRNDLDGVLHVGPLEIGDTVESTIDEPIAGVRVDLHRSTPDGGRFELLQNDTTDAAGDYGFVVDNGCFMLVFNAVAGISFGPDGQVNTLQKHVCTNNRNRNDVDVTAFKAVSLPTMPQCFTTVFRDDFNYTGAPGSGWTMYNGPGNRDFGVRNPEQASVSNGKLHLTAQMRDGVLHSAGMRTVLDQAYGSWEVRARVDADASAATSGVVLTWPQSQNWPYHGENNMFETAMVDENGNPAGRPDRTPVKSFVHYAENGAHKHAERIHEQSDGKKWATYTMEWTPTSVTYYRNGHATHTVTGAAVPQHSHFLAIQLDAWKHQMDGVVRMQVDYVDIKAYTC